MVYRSEVLADSPIHYYEMEAPTGVDSGSGNRTLTLGGDIVTGVSAKHGLAWEFDGVNDYASMATFPPLTSAFTFEAWVKSPSPLGLTANEYPTIIRRDGTHIVLLRLRGSALGVSPGLAEVYIDGTTLVSSSRVDDGQWHHVAYTQSGNTARLYVDGALEDTKTTARSTFNFGTGIAYVGSGGTVGERYQGTLDEVAIYNTALSASRIAAHFNAPAAASVSYAATPVDINVSSTTPELILNEIKISAEAVGVDVSTPDAKAEITWDGTRNITIIDDDFVAPSGTPWGSDWVITQDIEGLATHDSSGGYIRSRPSYSNSRTYAVSKDAHEGGLSFHVDVLSRSGTGTRNAWGLVAGTPSLTESTNLGWDADQYILVNRTGTSLFIKGPTESSEYYSATKVFTRVFVSGQTLRAWDQNGNILLSVTLPAGRAPTLPLRAFIGVGERQGSVLSTGSMAIGRATLVKTLTGVINNSPSFEIDITALGGNTSLTAYESAVVSKGAQVFYRGEGSGEDYIGSADLSLSGVTFTEGMSNERSAMQFNGSSYATSNPPVGAPETSYSEWTIELWINTGSYVGEFIRSTDASTGAHLSISTFGAMEGWHYDGGGSIVDYTLSDNGWHHLVLRKTSANNAPYAYVDGGSGRIVNWQGNGGNRPLSFNLDNFLVGDGLTGVIDNIAIYPRALSYAEIVDNHTLGRAEINEGVVNVQYTAEASKVSVLAKHPSVYAIRSVTYPPEEVSININTSGHGWHVTEDTSPEVGSVNINVSTLSPVVTGNEVVNVNTDAVTIDLSTVVPEVSAGDSVSLAVTIVDVEVTSLNARGGDPNKNMLFEAIETTVLAPNGAYAVGGHDEYVSAEAVEIEIDSFDPSVSNMTDVLIQADRIGVMIKLVGFYNREDDKWADFIGTTVGMGGAVWHRFDETGGSVVSDRWVEEQYLVPGYYDGVDPYPHANNGTYYGNPTFGVSALDNRKAVHLDGVDDWIMTGVRGGVDTYELIFSQELIFRTTDTGVLMSGFGRYQSQAGSIRVTDEGVEVISERPASGTGYTSTVWKVPIKVNDGQWHQIVWFHEDPSWGVGSYNGADQWTLMIDGEVAISRIPKDDDGLNLVNMNSIGSRQRSWPSGGMPPSTRFFGADPIEVDVMEFIGREWSGFSRDLAARSWRMLMGYNIIDAKAVDVTVSVPKDSRAKGNRKKMLVVYGGGPGPDRIDSYTTSSWSGMWTPAYSYKRSSSDAAGELATINGEGYLVYGVNQYTREGATVGILKDSPDRTYFDDYSGFSRYINVMEDLAVDVTEFDVIHFLHWPPPGDIHMDPGRWTEDDGREALQVELARKRLIENVRSVVDKGVSLWIADPQQAVDMGIAKGYEVHKNMSEGSTYFDGLGPRTLELDERFGPQYAKRTIHVAGDGEFIRERRIVASVDNFNEWETNYVGQRVGWWTGQGFTAHEDVYAYNVERRPDGLTIGSRMIMTAGARRGGDVGKHVVSLYPEGIKGTVIAREQGSYMMGSTEVENPWKDYATTVLVERGTIIDGRPVGGRIFVETMDNFRPSTSLANVIHVTEDDYPLVATEEFRTYMGGQPASPSYRSNWDFDIRRMKGVIMGDWILPDIKMYDTLPYAGMNDRGLVWMGIKPEEEFGKAQVFAEAVDVNVSTEGPVVQVVRHVEVTAPAPAEVRLEFRKPQNIADPDVTVNTTPVRITVTGGVYQRIFEVKQVPLITVGVVEPKVTGSGEDFIVYLRNENITLYLGED